MAENENNRDDGSGRDDMDNTWAGLKIVRQHGESRRDATPPPAASPAPPPAQPAVGQLRFRTGTVPPPSPAAPPVPGMPMPPSPQPGTTTGIRIGAPMPMPGQTTITRRSTMQGFPNLSQPAAKPAQSPVTAFNAPPLPPAPPPPPLGMPAPPPSSFPMPVPAPAAAPAQEQPPPVPMPMPRAPLTLKRKAEAVEAAAAAPEKPEKRQRHEIVHDIRLGVICVMATGAIVLTQILPQINVYLRSGVVPFGSLAVEVLMLLGVLGLILIDKTWSRVFVGIYLIIFILTAAVGTILLPVMVTLLAKWGRSDLATYLPTASNMAAAFALFLGSFLLLTGAGIVRWILAAVAALAALILPWTALEECLPHELDSYKVNLPDFSKLDDVGLSPTPTPEEANPPPVSVPECNFTAGRDYTFSLPVGWKLEPGNPSLPALSTLSSRDGLMQVTITFESAPDPVPPLRLVMDEKINGIRQEFSGAAVMDVSGKSDRKKIYAINDAEILQVLVVQKDRRRFILTARGDKNRMLAREGEVKTIFDSFELN